MTFKICITNLLVVMMTSLAYSQVPCPPSLPLTLVGNTEYCIGTPGSELSVNELYAGYEWLPTSETGQSVLLTAGDYELVVTHYTGCTDTVEIEIEQVSNPPQPSATADGPTQFCAGGSVTLSGPSGYPYYEWNSGSISESITVFETGTYVISIVDWLGCTSSSNSIQVIVDPLPFAMFSPNLNMFDIEFNNLSVDATDYEWNFGDGNTSTDFEPAYTYSTEGLHEMYLVASNNCGNDTAFLDLASVGIEEISISEMGIYPNPSSGLINIDVKSKIRQTISITVVDLSGRKVNGQLKNVQVGSSMLSVDCSSLYSGIYLLHLQSRSGSLSTRLIIQ
jgi:hypothetical protein